MARLYLLYPFFSPSIFYEFRMLQLPTYFGTCFVSGRSSRYGGMFFRQTVCSFVMCVLTWIGVAGLKLPQTSSDLAMLACDGERGKSR